MRMRSSALKKRVRSTRFFNALRCIRMRFFHIKNNHLIIYLFYTLLTLLFLIFLSISA